MNKSEWVVLSELWCTVEYALITEVRPGADGPPVGYLAGPLHDKVGAFSVGDLIRNGYVSVRDYCVMSPAYWAANKARLEREFEQELEVFFEQVVCSESGDSAWRVCLGLPPAGPLARDQILSGFRAVVKLVHPDRGGDAGAFNRALAARDGLLASVQLGTAAGR